MSDRVCGNCRWFDEGLTPDMTRSLNRFGESFGYCRRRSPIVVGGECFPSTHKTEWCGEWADVTITPEQEEMRELTRRFALALIMVRNDARRTWQIAAEFAAAEPQIQRENGQ